MKPCNIAFESSRFPCIVFLPESEDEVNSLICPRGSKGPVEMMHTVIDCNAHNVHICALLTDMVVDKGIEINGELLE